ncbi:MAG: DUF4434 domain-containing protein [Anaerolineae bacterium]|nr:DUF4434 domain-containing protein [Anaerolineae bacterium]
MELPLKGAFLQISNTVADASDVDLWGESISEMKRLKMDLIIIQTEAYLDAGGTRNAVARGYINTALKRAEDLEMKVWIGLVFPQDCVGSTECVKNEERFKDIISQSKHSADLIWNEWGTRQSFDGFYLPSEGWTPQAKDELGYLTKYLIEVSEHCRTKSDRLQIATSPFISNPTPDQSGITEEVYKNFLGDTFLTVLMLQDGVGGNNIPLDVVPAYMKAMKKACDDAGIEMWANIEAYVGSKAATFERVQKQIAAARQVTDKLVTFEFFKFWSHFSTTAGANKLNDSYYQRYILNE